MSRKPSIQSLHWRSETDHEPDGPVFTASGAHYRYDIEFVGSISECKLLANGDYVASGGSIQLQAIANEHNRRAIKLKTPYRSPIAPAQTDFLVAAGQNKAKVGDIPLIQYRYLHDDLALVDYLADPAIPDWKDFAVMLTERGVEYLEWRDEQFRKRAPATWVTEREELRAALAQTKAAFDQVAPALAKTEADLDSLKRSSLGYQGKIASLTMQVTDGERALELTREELAFARTAHASIKDELGAYRKKVNEDRGMQERHFREAAFKAVSAEMSELKENARIASAEIERLNRDLEESMKVRGGLARTVTEVRGKLTDAEMDLNALQEREKDLTRIIEHLREQLARADDRNIEVELDRRRLTEIVKANVIPQEVGSFTPKIVDPSDYELRPDEVKTPANGRPRKHGFYALGVGQSMPVTADQHHQFKKAMGRYTARSGHRFSLRKHEGGYRCVRLT